jgi:hypothetical protein
MRQTSRFSVLDASTSAPLQPYPHHHVIGVVDVVETEVLVEADGAFVAGVDSEVDPGNSPGPELIEEAADHLPTHTSPLQDGEQVDVEMGRISSHDLVGWSLRTMDEGDDLSVIGRRIIGDLLGIPLPQRRPPLGLAFGLESPGVDRGQDVPGRNAFLDRGVTDSVRHQQVRPHIDLTEEAGVCEASGGVLPSVTGAETDVIEGV